MWKRTTDCGIVEALLYAKLLWGKAERAIQSTYNDAPHLLQQQSINSGDKIISNDKLFLFEKLINNNAAHCYCECLRYGKLDAQNRTKYHANVWIECNIV